MLCTLQSWYGHTCLHNSIRKWTKNRNTETPLAAILISPVSFPTECSSHRWNTQCPAIHHFKLCHLSVGDIDGGGVFCLSLLHSQDFQTFLTHLCCWTPHYFNFHSINERSTETWQEGTRTTQSQSMMRGAGWCSQEWRHNTSAVKKIVYWKMGVSQEYILASSELWNTRRGEEMVSVNVLHIHKKTEQIMETRYLSEWICLVMNVSCNSQHVSNIHPVFCISDC